MPIENGVWEYSILLIKFYMMLVQNRINLDIFIMQT